MKRRTLLASVSWALGFIGRARSQSLDNGVGLTSVPVLRKKIGTNVAPVLTWTSAPYQSTPSFTAAFVNPLVGDILILQWASDAGFSSIVGTSTNTVDAGEQGSLTATFTTGGLLNGTHYFRCDHNSSPWSSTVIVTIGASTAPTLAWTNTSSSTMPTFNAALTGAVAGDIITLQTANDAAFTSLVDSITDTVDVGQQASQIAPFTHSALTKATYYCRAKNNQGLWSNTVTVTISATFVTSQLFSGGYKGGWWDSTDKTKLWVSNARTTQVATAGDLVGAMDDKSGNANHMKSVADDTSRPTYQTTGLVFDASNDHLEALMGASITATTLTGIAVISVPSYTLYGRVMCLNNASGPTPPAYASAPVADIIYQPNATGGFCGNRFGANGGISSNTATSTLVMILSEFDGITQNTRKNAEAVVSAAGSTANFNGNYLMLGLSGGQYANCTIVESLIIDRVLTAGEKTSLFADWNARRSVY